MKSKRITPGHPLPAGATLTSDGVQFSLISRYATSVHLLLYRKSDDNEPYECILLDPKTNKTGSCWHIFVKGLKKGQLYLYRVDGLYKPEKGHRYNRNRVLIDPYSKALTGNTPWNLRKAFGYDPNHPDGDLSFSTSRNYTCMPKCVVVDDFFDWQGDQPLNYPLHETIIYETHLRGLTRHPNTIKHFGLKNPGTCAGVIEMIPYLSELGITSIEFLPVAEFDEHESGDKSITNYWGYSTTAFFAPKGSYAVSSRGMDQVIEFKTMVRELHRAGIEIILDVVFNHTGEGNHTGPTYSFRGLDNSIYYMLEEDQRFYRNYSGCGNTLNCNHPVVRKLIIDCLRYWVQEMHVDGFRFDLASILTRDGEGRIMDNPPILESIAEDVVLHSTKIIAEPWDAGGAWQVGNFYGDPWAEWNDRYRDDVKRFWRGDPGMINAFATRISGSSDLYASSGKKPYHSINYITSHDGFTLHDLVSYNQKHNEANGEENRDGSDNNLSCNWGIEGETCDESILVLRTRTIKNFWATLLLSSGTPMILAGDEFQRTQKGNNNAYCHNSELSWYDFSRLETHADTYRFARLIINFRRNHSTLQHREFFTGDNQSGGGKSDIDWFDEHGNSVDWNRQKNILALRIYGTHGEEDIVVYFNSTTNSVHFHLPEPPEGCGWYRVVDTALDPPQDIAEAGEEVQIARDQGYRTDCYSMVVLIGKQES